MAIYTHTDTYIPLLRPIIAVEDSCGNRDHNHHDGAGLGRDGSKLSRLLCKVLEVGGFGLCCFRWVEVLGFFGAFGFWVFEFGLLGVVSLAWRVGGLRKC